MSIFNRKDRWKNVKPRDVDRVDLGADDNYKPERFQAATQKVEGLLKKFSEGYRGFKESVSEINRNYGRRILIGLAGLVAGSAMLAGSYNFVKDPVRKGITEISYLGYPVEGKLMSREVPIPKYVNHDLVPTQQKTKVHKFSGAKLEEFGRADIYAINLSQSEENPSLQVLISDNSARLSYISISNVKNNVYYLCVGERVDPAEVRSFLNSNLKDGISNSLDLSGPLIEIYRSTFEGPKSRDNILKYYKSYFDNSSN